MAVASELHFGRAAERLHLAQPTLSELVQRLERELGTALFVRTTRRVALTDAGAELLGRARTILDEVAAAAAAVRRIADGEAGIVRVGMTPPVAPVLAPHLAAALEREAPGIDLVLRRMWLPDLMRAVAEGTVDVALTCGTVPDSEGVQGAVFCGEPLLVGVRRGHRDAGREHVQLQDLRHDVLGVPDPALFPAWAMAQQQVLAEVGITPPTVLLDATDLTAGEWAAQSDIDWVLMTRSVQAASTDTVARPVSPEQLLPFTVQWNVSRAHAAAVARFVRLALTVAPPPGWSRGTGYRG